ncbi:magnesium chelatase subunit ChlI family protein [Escherichia coli]
MERNADPSGVIDVAWQRLLKVARTIADIDQSDIITRQHLQEAVSYRAIDRLLIHLQKLLT